MAHWSHGSEIELSNEKGPWGPHNYCLKIILYGKYIIVASRHYNNHCICIYPTAYCSEWMCSIHILPSKCSDSTHMYIFTCVCTVYNYIKTRAKMNHTLSILNQEICYFYNYSNDYQHYVCGALHCYPDFYYIYHLALK